MIMKKRSDTSPLVTAGGGFTVVELLVVIGIMALLSVMVFGMFSTTSSNQQKVSTDLQMQAMILNSQNRIVRAVREGIDFILPELGEESAALFFADSENNIRILYQQKDEELSKRTGKILYKLVHQKVETKDFNVGSPASDPKLSTTVAEYVKDIKFRVSSANTVNITACFATERAEFQTMFEIGLQNSGVVE